MHFVRPISRVRVNDALSPADWFTTMCFETTYVMMLTVIEGNIGCYFVIAFSSIDGAGCSVWRPIRAFLLRWAFALTNDCCVMSMHGGYRIAIVCFVLLSFEYVQYVMFCKNTKLS